MRLALLLAISIPTAMGAAGYINPQDVGGSMLTSWPETEGNHEPLNVILSAESDPIVLKDSPLRGGFRAYMHTANMAREFLGLHSGARQLANLDGSQYVREVRVLRFDYGKPVIGTGLESLRGGNHARYWVQPGSGAYFLAVSAEKDLKGNHEIIENGYNRGRDMLVSALVGKNVETAKVKAGDRFEGTSRYLGWKYHTSVEYVAGLLNETDEGINHAQNVGGGGPAIDGLVAVLTVTIRKRGLLKKSKPPEA